MEAAALEALLPQLPAFESTFTQGPDRLVDWFTLVPDLDRRMMRLFVYAYFANSVDANDRLKPSNMPLEVFHNP